VGGGADGHGRCGPLAQLAGARRTAVLAVRRLDSAAAGSGTVVHVSPCASASSELRTGGEGCCCLVLFRELLDVIE